MNNTHWVAQWCCAHPLISRSRYKLTLSSLSLQSQSVATMNRDVIDLCESNEEEASPTRIVQNGDIICIDSSDDESTNDTAPVPPKQDTVPKQQKIIELDDSDSSDDDVPIVVETVALARMPSTSIMPLDDSDFDSSDDAIYSDIAQELAPATNDT